jgi:hypothetical protein
MCAICTLPTTHANTFSTISMVSLFLMVFWTFIWAWWIVTKIRVENYFVDTFHSIRTARQGGYGKTMRRLFLTNKKYQIIVVLILVSVGMLVWAALSDREVTSNAELIILDPYVAVPSVEPINANMLQLDRL